MGDTYALLHQDVIIKSKKLNSAQGSVIQNNIEKEFVLKMYKETKMKG